MRWFITGWLAVAAAALAGSAPEAARPPEPGEFHFVRMYYNDYAGARGGFGGGFGRGWWQQDWDDAEVHFTANLIRLTRVNVGENRVVDLLDDRLFDYPWLYATQTGYWDLSNEELDHLREYLLRGGFLMCDDFWGEDEWSVFEQTMLRLFPPEQFPDSPIEELHGDEAVLHVVYSIDEHVQIPGLRFLREVDSLPPPKWYGIYDDNRRLMVGINYNQDVGDSWEEANNPDYPVPMTTLGYRFGINYIVYAMTH
jgi:hypothetical protein